MQNMKRPIDYSIFFTFFYNNGPNFAQILPQDNTHFVFLAGFLWNMLGDSINNNFNWNLIVWLRIGKMSKKYNFWAQLVQKRGHDGPRPKQNNFFLQNKIFLQK